MKRLFFALAAVAVFASPSLAGWATPGANDEGYLDGSLGAVVGFPRVATTASDGSIASLPVDSNDQLANISGCMVGYIIDFAAGGSAPTSVVAAIKDKYGLVINPDTDDTVNTGDVRVAFDSPVCVAGGITVDFTVVGNTKIFTFAPIFLR